MPSVSRANNHDKQSRSGRQAAGTDDPAKRDPAKGRSGARAKSAKIPEPLQITLEHARWRHLIWAITSLAIGGALTLKLGAVGKMLGIIALVLAARSAFLFVRTLLKPAGTIRVDRNQVVLPDGLCRGSMHTFAIDAVRHAYFLRRAVPWTQTAPLLVIETRANDDNAADPPRDIFTYPRDWFESESDQRRIVQAIHHHRERAGSSAEKPR